jgi:hypothetical protein
VRIVSEYAGVEVSYSESEVVQAGWGHGGHVVSFCGLVVTGGPLNVNPLSPISGINVELGKCAAHPVDLAVHGRDLVGGDDLAARLRGSGPD